MFLESLCDDPSVIAANVELKASAGDPDYKNMSHEEAVADFKRRIEQYQNVYETIEPFEWEGMDIEKSPTPAERLESEEQKERHREDLIMAAARNPGKDNPRQALVTRDMARNVSYLKVINVGRQVRAFLASLKLPLIY